MPTSSAPTPKQKETIDLYTSLMEEAKTRLASIGITLGGKTGLPELLADEFCVLQLRMFCELIALGCLVAHGDIQATHTKKFRKEYSAEKICEMLEALHPDYYPHPVRQIESKPPHPFGLEEVDTGYLTKEELPKLVGKCGASLHRGTGKNMYLRTMVPQEIIAWWSKIHTLLDIHWFTLVSGEPHYLLNERRRRRKSWGRPAA